MVNLFIFTVFALSHAQSFSASKSTLVDEVWVSHSFMTVSPVVYQGLRMLNTVLGFQQSQPIEQTSEQQSAHLNVTVKPNINPLLTEPVSKVAQESVDNAKRLENEVDVLCSEIGELLGSVSVENCLSHKFVHSGHYSVLNRALVYKDVRELQVGLDEKLPKILVIGGIHGDEYSAFSIVFQWLNYIRDHEVSLKYHWRFLPAANPDGLLAFKPAQRMNAHGVDLNRNFATNDWRDKAVKYWQQKTGKDARRNPGKAAASEPETLWLSDLISSWQPDVIVSIHAPYGILDFDSTEQKRLTPPKKLGMLHLKLLGTYPGSLGRYAAINRNIPVLTIELPNAGIMPSKSKQIELWSDLQRWLEKHFDTH